MKDICIYVVLTVVLYAAMVYITKVAPVWAQLVVNTLLIVLFLAYIIRKDLPLSGLPVIGKYFRH